MRLSAVIRRLLGGLLLLAAAGGAAPEARQLTFKDRLAAQEAIERVYFAHQIDATAPFEEAVSPLTIEGKVLKYLRQSAALQQRWGRPITAEMLVAEHERMVRDSQMPARLAELHKALGDDPLLILECLVRPALADQLARRAFAEHEGKGGGTTWGEWWPNIQGGLDPGTVATVAVPAALKGVAVPEDQGPATAVAPDGFWVNGVLDDPPVGPLPRRHGHAAVWTGNLLLVWGGRGDGGSPYYSEPGDRYDPAIDAWSVMGIVNAPINRSFAAVVWTGSEMVVWGGENYGGAFNQHGFTDTGGRYDPIADSWVYIPGAGSSAQGTSGPRAIWSGSLMGVLGGDKETDCHPWGCDVASTRDAKWYDPATGLWGPYFQLPDPRSGAVTLWAGGEVLVFGGHCSDNPVPPFPSGCASPDDLSYGYRYNTVTTTWTRMSRLDPPLPAGGFYSGVWTGVEMVVWGAWDGTRNSGGRYDPGTDSWRPISQVNAPISGDGFTTVWTGQEMIVWGGSAPNAGGRYDPVSDTWAPVSQIDAPSQRSFHAAVWSDASMIIWGGAGDILAPYTGGRYLAGCGQADLDGDGWCPAVGDCDETRASVHPKAFQICDGLNNDCADPQWPALAGTNEADDDSDGFAECGTPADCDDMHASVYPGAAQVCGDSLNNDCLDPVWPASQQDQDLDGDGSFLCDTIPDCSDTQSVVYPGAPQLCDGLNNDCLDPAWPALPAAEANEDSDLYRVCEGDCDDSSPSVYPGAQQICGDGLNNDCLDPSWPASAPTDSDDDGDGQAECGAPSDCDDSRATVYSFAPQLCGDGLNNDCRHAAWPALTGTNESDDDGDGFLECSVTPDCDDSQAGAWGTPGEVGGVTAAYLLPGGTTTLQWTAPVPPGGTVMTFDVLRAPVPWDFVADTACVESNGGDFIAADSDQVVPFPLGTYFYLIRAENGCAGATGRGVLGRSSTGSEIIGRSCP